MLSRLSPISIVADRAVRPELAISLLAGEMAGGPEGVLSRQRILQIC